ncbi:hypothetical protein R3P38DRAFT_3165928 [Favolaschia claudopus]|uniref:Uncharacterized protein n=1 Tax=Favolaschia claudopus TaxID=2862362 RepID=A0AAW0EHM1_9AGAR
MPVPDANVGLYLLDVAPSPASLALLPRSSSPAVACFSLLVASFCRPVVSRSLLGLGTISYPSVILPYPQLHRLLGGGTLLHFGRPRLFGFAAGASFTLLVGLSLIYDVHCRSFSPRTPVTTEYLHQRRSFTIDTLSNDAPSPPTLICQRATAARHHAPSSRSFIARSAPLGLGPPLAFHAVLSLPMIHILPSRQPRTFAIIDSLWHRRSLSDDAPSPTTFSLLASP